jgi:hypothetical protein
MPVCTRCRQQKEPDQFYKRSREKPGDYHTECKVCFKTRMGERHHRHKVLLVEEFGGCCQRCGYQSDPRALVFHHIDPSTKSFTIAQRLSASLKTLRKEVQKCVLLCPNCHTEHHLGLWEMERKRRGQIPRKSITPQTGMSCDPVCADCGVTISRGSQRCRKCAAARSPSSFPQRVDWPPTGELLQRVAATNFSQVGREFGVSDNAVRKRIRKYPPESPCGFCFRCARETPLPNTLCSRCDAPSRN